MFLGIIFSFIGYSLEGYDRLALCLEYGWFGRFGWGSLSRGENLRLEAAGTFLSSLDLVLTFGLGSSLKKGS